MTRRQPAARSLAQQAFALRAAFPHTSAKLTATLLDWTGDLQPTTLSRTYTVRVVYRLDRFPNVTVLEPTLESRPGESLPHVFDDGSLCLHLEHDWTPNMLLVDTTLPWTAEWLIHYELWKHTGAWYGGGEWPPARNPDVATATDAMLSPSGTQVVPEPR
jgi:hypothetical protein